MIAFCAIWYSVAGLMNSVLVVLISKTDGQKNIWNASCIIADGNLVNAPRNFSLLNSKEMAGALAANLKYLTKRGVFVCFCFLKLYFYNSGMLSNWQ